MAETRETSADHFDLLPFIAILMCVLGCLLLVTLCMAAISLGAGVAERWTPVAATGQATSGRPATGPVAASAAVAPKKPILVEWDGDQAIFHLESGKVLAKWSPPTGVPGGDQGAVTKSRGAFAEGNRSAVAAPQDALRAVCRASHGFQDVPCNGRRVPQPGN